MQEIVIDLHITADEYQKYYQQPGTVVCGDARDGRKVRFPANILHPYISYSGVKGTFRVLFNEDGKFLSIDKLD
jgi:hypothetical protein